MANAYTDENGVFKNRLGISDAQLLHKMEYELVAQRSIEIESGEIQLVVDGYGLARQQAIHAHLFQDVYEWAGQIRTTLSVKRMDNGQQSRFVDFGTIVGKWENLEKITQAFVTRQGMGFDQKHDALAEIFITANCIHAFPEGNGRSLQVFMKQLAQEQNIGLDYTKVKPKEWNRASAISGEHGRLFEHAHFIASKPDTAPIKQIFSDISRPLD